MENPTYNIICYVLLGLSWIVFLIFWILSARRAKKTLSTKSKLLGIIIRFIFIITIILLFKIPGFRETVRHYQTFLINPIAMGFGVVTDVAGLSFAIWARVHLGKNWGAPMAIKENPELITGGPYRYIRHPIYTGMIFGAFGSALVFGLPWLIVCVFACMYFTYAAYKEEKLMTAQFPVDYPLYKSKTKMLIPFVF
jgi:protein-S-isoprenylcysteine O-methyltransferase Ste14